MVKNIGEANGIDCRSHSLAVLYRLYAVRNIGPVNTNSAQPRRTAGIFRLLAVPLVVFILSFSLVPLYRIACEKVFGIRVERSASSLTTTTLASPQRTVRVEFDGGVNSRLPWAFYPEKLIMDVVPGELNEVKYFARNTSDHVLVGSAVPSVAPARASSFFNKIECFCFTSQTLYAGEQREMPVRFIVDPDLPDDIRTLTLSYTFYKNDPLTAKLLASVKPNIIGE